MPRLVVLGPGSVEWDLETLGPFLHCLEPQFLVCMTNTGWRLTAALAPTRDRSPEESLRLSEMTLGPGMRR